MFKINSYADLKVAYAILEIAYESGRSQNQKIADLKREMRTFFHRPISERHIIQDDGIDGYTELLPLPEYIETIDEAVSYFEDYEYMPYCPSAYDCTGQKFTSWYKVFARNNRFWAYHRVSMDL